MAPGQGPRDRGREVLPYCCQSRSSTEHMKGIHSRFYGPRWLLKPLLWSEFMYPIARINNASLIRDPRDRDPWREGCWEKNQVQCALFQCCAPPQIIILKNVFIGKNLFHKFIKDVPPYIFQCGVIVSLCRERLCYRHAAVFKDTKVTAFMNFHSGTYCFHQLLYLMSLSPPFSL